MLSTDSFTALVDHGAVDPRVGENRIDLQLRTAAAITDRVQANGGAILGDEVGAGKTYVSFALLVEALAREPGRGAVILVPKELLKVKWCRELSDYLRRAVRDRALGQRLARRIFPMSRNLRHDGTVNEHAWGASPKPSSIVVACHSVFSFRISDADRASTLHSFLRERVHGRRRPQKRFFRACGLDADTWYGDPGWADPGLFHRYPETLSPLDEVFRLYEDGERDLSWHMQEATQVIRRKVGRRRLPDAALLIIDEAHNLRSTSSQVYRSLMEVLDGRFDGLVFLTATPFQLGPQELLNIVNFFSRARGAANRQTIFERRVDLLAAGMDGYVAALAVFERGWRQLSEDQTQRCLELVSADEELIETDAVAQVAARFREALEAKNRLEAAMSPFVVRSVRDRDHREHRGVLEFPGETIAESSRVPLALVDRMLYEIVRSPGGRTFIASQLVSACSSWQSLRSASAMIADGQVGAQPRALLKQLDASNCLGPHPKVQASVGIAYEGSTRNSSPKTLIFVERIETGRALRDRIQALVRDDRDENAYRRLQDRRRFGWPSLRENYLHTIYPQVFGAPPNPGHIRSFWDAAEAQELWRLVDADGERNYGIEKRFWEHLFVAQAARRNRGRLRSLPAPLVEAIENLSDPRYVMNGLDLVTTETGDTTPIPEEPRRAKFRGPRFEFAEAFLRYQSPWAPHASLLAEIWPIPRAAFVDAVARAIATSHLQQEVAALEVEGDAAAHFRAVEGLLSDPGRGWPRRFSALCDRAADLLRNQPRDLAETAMSGLIDALGGQRRVQFIGGQSDQATKQRAVDGFNTPLYPDVLIATGVLAEGIDLHRYCRRVIHHDLPWNPARLEQRTGRIDRVGSLSERLALESDGRADSAIDVWLLYVPGTYDQFVFERVMARRREFRCLLGNRPEWESETLAEDERGVPIAAELTDALQVHLGPGV